MSEERLLRWEYISKPKMFILIVAYEAETTIAGVLHRMPAGLTAQYEIRTPDH
jgi:hypothetical protein